MKKTLNEELSFHLKLVWVAFAGFVISGTALTYYLLANITPIPDGSILGYIGTHADQVFIPLVGLMFVAALFHVLDHHEKIKGLMLVGSES